MSKAYSGASVFGYLSVHWASAQRKKNKPWERNWLYHVTSKLIPICFLSSASFNSALVQALFISHLITATSSDGSPSIGFVPGVAAKSFSQGKSGYVSFGWKFSLATIQNLSYALISPGQHGLSPLLWSHPLLLLPSALYPAAMTFHDLENPMVSFTIGYASHWALSPPTLTHFA